MYVTAQLWKTEPCEEGENRRQQGKAESTSSSLNKFIVYQSFFFLVLCFFSSILMFSELWNFSMTIFGFTNTSIFTPSTQLRTIGLIQLKIWTRRAIQISCGGHKVKEPDFGGGNAWWNISFLLHTFNCPSSITVLAGYRGFFLPWPLWPALQRRGAIYKSLYQVMLVFSWTLT